MKNMLMAVVLAFSAGLAVADGDMKPQQGGVMAEAKSGHRVELVAQPKMLTVYLTDHGGKPVDTKKVTAEITLLAGTEKTTTKLEPSGGNTLMAHGKFTVTSGTKGIVKFVLPGKPEEQVRISLK